MSIKRKLKLKSAFCNILKLLNLDNENIQLKILTLNDLNEQLTTQKRLKTNDKLLIFIIYIYIFILLNNHVDSN